MGDRLPLQFFCIISTDYDLEHKIIQPLLYITLAEVRLNKSKLTTPNVTELLEDFKIHLEAY